MRREGCQRTPGLVTVRDARGRLRTAQAFRPGFGGVVSRPGGFVGVRLDRTGDGRQGRPSALGVAGRSETVLTTSFTCSAAASFVVSTVWRTSGRFAIDRTRASSS